MCKCYTYYVPRKRGDVERGNFVENNESEKILIEVRLQLARIEEKLNDVPEIKNDLKETATRLDKHAEKIDKAYTMSMHNREAIGELKAKYDWLSKTVIGAIITAVVGVLVKTYLG